MADLRVCSPNYIVENCADCGVPIYLRPHGQMDCKKICTGCFQKIGLGVYKAEIPAETSQEILNLKRSGNWPVKPLRPN